MLLQKFIVYCISFIVFAFFASPAFAQTTLRLADAPSGPSVPTAPAAYNLPPAVSPVSPLYTDLLVHNMFHTFSCLAIGQSVIGQPCLTYLQGVPVLSQVNTSGGALGATTNIIGLLYQNPPVRTADYLASLGEGLGIVKVANAQVGGSGAQVLSPILKLWQVSRNISYVIMIIIFLVIGLMVMFRNKINPQTVITAQAALPGLVIGLIMITFSFFFAGLISDMAFVGTGVVGYYFQAAQGIPIADQQNLLEKTQDKSVLQIFSKFVGTLKREDAEQAVDAIFNNFSPQVQIFIRLFVGIITYQFSSQIGGLLPANLALLGPVIGIGSALLGQTMISPTLGFIISFLSVAVLIYTMLKLLLRLVNCYITILFLTISAPFQFLAASLPGRQKAVTGWILNMLANVLAFPAVMAVFYLANYLLGSNATDAPFQVITNSSITGRASFPLFGGMDISFLRIVVAFVALLATPAIPDIISRALGQANQAGQMIGQEIGGGIRSGQGYVGQAGGAFRTVSQQFSGLRDEPGYIFQNGKWIRVTSSTPGLSEEQQFRSGMKPGSGSKLGSIGKQPLVDKKPTTDKKPPGA